MTLTTIRKELYNKYEDTNMQDVAGSIHDLLLEIEVQLSNIVSDKLIVFDEKIVDDVNTIKKDLDILIK